MYVSRWGQEQLVISTLSRQNGLSHDQFPGHCRRGGAWNPLGASESGARAHDDPCGAPCEQPGQQRQAYPRRAIGPPRLQGPLHVQGQLPAQESNLCIQRLAW